MATVQRAKTPVSSTTAGKTNGGSKAITTTSTMTATTTAPASGPDQIAARAYQIWQESGCPNGKDQEHWFRAERELRAKTTVRP
jgi:hypothetical protein